MNVVIAYFNAMIVITSMTLVFIFKYMTKYQTSEYMSRFENTKINYENAEDFRVIERLKNMSTDPLQYGM
tara:strand:- start:257 stop:466 length:210 start_codon:yes stop_codon:yes gene_type:complete